MTDSDRNAPTIKHARRGRIVPPGESQLRLQTIVRLRWIAVLAQMFTVCAVWLGLGFPLPIGYCLAVIALSAWMNVFLTIRFPARHRFGTRSATALLAYDIVQLAALLYLTGGIENPFALLLVAPVTVSAATLPPRHTILLGLMAAVAACILVAQHQPLPWFPGLRVDLPLLYRVGMLASICVGMTFLGLYVWRLSKEGRQMSAALVATELVLAREQKLHALDDLAAAAAHELGTPLATITLVAKELQRDAVEDSPLAEDLQLLSSQAARCRQILQKLTRRSGEADPLHASLSVREMIDEAAAPYRLLGKVIDVGAGPAPGASNSGATEPIGERRPGVIYGIGNIIENAVDFAEKRVEIRAEWSADSVSISIVDDGPGFPPDIIDTLGEPYVSTRASAGQRQSGEASGLGLGYFIAKTLLERSGANVFLENRPAQQRGAIVRIVWRRSRFEARLDGSSSPGERPARQHFNF